MAGDGEDVNEKLQQSWGSTSARSADFQGVAAGRKR